MFAGLIQAGRRAAFDPFHFYQFFLQLLPFNFPIKLDAITIVRCRNNPDIHRRLNTVFINKSYKSKSAEYIGDNAVHS